MNSQTTDEVLRRLKEAFTPSRIQLVDESHLHEGHHSHGNGLHLSLELTSELFLGKTSLERQKQVYFVLDDLFRSQKIHALSMNLKEPQ